MRISNSFSEGEIQVMDFIVQTLLRGGTPTMATRHKEFASLCRKIMAMKSKVIKGTPRTNSINVVLAAAMTLPLNVICNM